MGGPFINCGNCNSTDSTMFTSFSVSIPSLKFLISGFPPGCPAEGVRGVGGQRDLPSAPVPRH